MNETDRRKRIIDETYKNWKAMPLEQPLPLLWHKGKSVIRPDDKGTPRYVYNTGTEDIEIDPRSTVDPRTEHIDYSDYLLAKMTEEEERQVAVEAVAAEIGETALLAS